MNKNGLTLIELAKEITRQSEQKRDFLANTRKVRMTPESTLELFGVDEFAINNHAHKQLATWSGIGARYYDKLAQEAPALLAENVNHWLQEKPADRMIRTLDGKVRAWLSSSYKRIDNDFVASVVLEEIAELGDLNAVVSSAVTDERLYIQVAFPRVQQEVKLGDPVQGGMIISNGEIGNGAINVRPFVYRLVCENGLITMDNAVGGYRRHHIGAKNYADDNITIYSQETMQADDNAIALKTRDIIRSLASGEWFDLVANKMRDATQGETIKNPIPAVDELANRFSLNKNERDSVLTSLLSQGDYTRYGLLNAVTAAANSAGSYDRSVELEDIGGRILNINRRDWSSIVEAEQAY